MHLRQRQDIELAVDDMSPTEAQETLRAIMVGEVDALIVEGNDGPAVYTLKDAHHPYRAIIERMSEGGVVLGEDGIVLYCNNSFASFVGRDKSALLGQPLQACVTAEHHRRLGSVLTLAQSAPAATELDLVRHHGTLPVYLSASPIDIDDWKSCIALVVTDLTIRRRSEYIAAAEEFARSVLDQAADAIIVCDAAGAVSHASLTAQALCDASPVGRAFDLAFPLRLAGGDGDCRPFGRCESAQGVEVHMACRSGELRRFLARESALKNPRGQPIGRIVTLTDITERIRAEEALRESEERYRTLFETLTEGFCTIEMIFDAAERAVDGRFLEVNPAFERQTGLHDAKGMLLSELAPHDEVHCLEIYGKTALTGEPACFEHKARAQNLWYNVLAYRVGGPQSRKVAILFNDITERKKAEYELRDAIVEAERANNAKSRFLAAASHDLRQPLSALSIYTDLLKGKLGRDDAHLVANIKDCVGSLSELLNDLLDLSKLEAGVVKPQVSDFSVGELINRVVSAHAPDAGLKRLRLRSRPSGLTARTDPVLLARLLGNLVANAVRYTRHGGVLIACRRYRGKTWIEVRDTGIGIAEDKTAEIFEEFRQLHNDERGLEKGSGLGLAIVARAAALLGLEIRVRSRPGRGSLFAVELPLGSALPDVVPVESIPLRPARIALVDDNALVLDALVCVLERAGHDVVSATTSQELLTRLDGRAPDVVISDFRLGGGETGFEVVTAVRAVFGDTLAALIITGDTDPKLMRSMADRGVLVHHKPLDYEALEASIANLIAHATPGRPAATAAIEGAHDVAGG